MAAPQLAPSVALQGDLFDRPSPGGAPTAPLTDAKRLDLGEGAWVDHLPGWLPDSDDLFDQLCHNVSWEQHTMPMYDRVVAQPRLSASCDPHLLPGGSHSGLVAATEALEEHYGVPLGGCWLNLYRDGRDGVAWHGDRHGRRLPEALVAIISLGARRPFRLRPVGGGRSHRWDLGRGDLLVMGGTCQRTWQHTVPKVARAGPRLSISLRWPVS